MKKIIATVLASAALIGSAFAADLPSRKSAPAYVAPAPIMLWQGAYLGANIGGGWKSNGNGRVWAYDPVNLSSMTWGLNNSNGNAGVVGGVTAGYNYQVNPWLVVGAETDFQGTSMSGGQNAASNVAYIGGLYPNMVAGYTGGTNINWFGTVRGRVGVVPLSPALMVYGTGGFAYGNVSRNGTFVSSNALQTGWTAGGGVEYKITPNWSVKGEYLYTDLSGSNNSVTNAGFGLNNVNNNTRFNTVRAGLNYHFTDFMPTLAKF